ncbi:MULTISPECIES: hypothetical protein [Anaeromyxobacter]|uniref:hypothetical protein n=1 Tax=Anaeromyxobacter TaxID=161492 RepID=UPI001F5937F3|nr:MULTISPECIES: hypothetical protein [unclassified Anaeromyxobacter]
MNPIPSIHVANTTERKTEPDRFGAALRTAAASAARGVAASVELAAPFVPGGTVVSGALRSAAGTLASGGATGGAHVAETAGAEGDIVAATRALQQQSQSFNLQYLQLQENMQRESREFAALSNVMKVKHDSAKSAINNIH